MSTVDPQARLTELEAEVAGLRAERDTLRRAVHHQVRNDFQTVCSLLNLQSLRVSDPAAQAALRECQNRVRSLALVHDGLARAAATGAAAHLEAVCRELAGAHEVDGTRVRVAVEAPAAPLRRERSVACTLVVTELVSNALRHAFPAGRPGTVTVRLTTDAAGGYELTVADDGVGLPADVDVRQPQNLGLQLVTALAQQAGGEATVERREGTTFRVTLPNRSGERAV